MSNTTTAAKLVAITGNTYPVKEQLKALGARWNADAKAWMISEAKASQAKAIVESAGPKKSFASTPARSLGVRTYGFRRNHPAGPRTGCYCGSRENYSQPTDCARCKFDQDDN